MDNMISICTDGAPSMIGKRKVFVSRVIEDRSVFTIHCALCLQKLVANNIGSRDLITILQTVVSSVNKIRIQALLDRIFHDTCSENFFVGWSISQTYDSCLTRFVLLFAKERHYCVEFTY